MKNKLILSTIVATLLVGATALSANTDGLNDSVSKKEQTALTHSTNLKGDASAQAKVEETISKDHYMAKLDADNFKTEAQRDDAMRLHKIVDKQLHIHNSMSKKAPKEVMDGLKETFVALKALQMNNVKEAKKALTSATKLFDTAFKNNPQLSLVPIAQKVEVNDFTGNAKTIKHIINAAQKLLADNDTQAARAILLPLQDEMTFSTQLLPMKIYPQATKQALKDLNKGKKKQAFGDIVTALNSTVVSTVVLPLPLLTAQDLVLEASKLEKSKKDQALKLLTSAQDELTKAELLGYTKKDSKAYKSLEKEISNIKTEIKGKNMVDKMYDHIKNSFEKLIAKHKKEAKQDNAK